MGAAQKVLPRSPHFPCRCRWAFVLFLPISVTSGSAPCPADCRMNEEEWGADGRRGEWVDGWMDGWTDD